MDSVDCAVVGAGVVGLACAEALAMRGLDVVVLEAADAIGTETSSRNSEVIHAGIYYSTGSLKARFCVEGKHRLYARAEAAGIPVNNCGKLIVATDPAQTGALERLKEQAAANGVPDLEVWSAARARALEPNLACAAALWSPSTGIVDSHALMLSLQGGLESHGGMIAFHAPVLGGEAGTDGIVLQVGGSAPMRLRARRVVNSAGLHAPRLGAAIAGVPPETVPAAHYAKGNYYTLVGRSPFSRLIYPVPEPGGLGVHVTIDMAGQTRFGPDVEWLDGPDFDYEVDPARAEGFYAAVRRYWPGLPDGALLPAYCGVRPKITGPGETPADYVVQDETVHGVKGLIQLYGIESPGLTSALAIGAAVADRLA